MTEKDEVIEVLYRYQTELSDGFGYYTDDDTLTNLAKDIIRIFVEIEEGMNKTCERCGGEAVVLSRDMVMEGYDRVLYYCRNCDERWEVVERCALKEV